jgi:hypothetical protein
MRTYYYVENLDRPFTYKSMWTALIFEKDRRGVVVEPEDANLVSSRLKNNMHSPVIDLDIPHALVPSTQPGHSHLYLGVEIPWWRYLILLAAMRQAGIIERGFFWWSLRRRATFVRLPWIKKDVEQYESTYIHSRAQPKRSSLSGDRLHLPTRS